MQGLTLQCTQLPPLPLSSPFRDMKRREDKDAIAAQDENTGAQVVPIVKLEEVAITTYEEDEDAILDLKEKLYRFNKERNQWKEEKETESE